MEARNLSKIKAPKGVYLSWPNLQFRLKMAAPNILCFAFFINHSVSQYIVYFQDLTQTHIYDI